MNKNPNRWLDAHRWNLTSDDGEEGIIEKILERIPDPNRWCVEFGACDGLERSNTHNLVAKKRYAGVLIEPDARKFRGLERTYAGRQDVTLINGFVGLTAEDGLDRILEATPAPRDLDLVSIDIDGNDYYVWRAIQVYRPRVVVIEFNPTIPNSLEFVQPRDPAVNQGSSLLAMCNLAKEKGYELVATTTCNAFFVDAKYFPLFGITDNSIHELRPEAEAPITYIFNGYDGTVFLRGHRRLIWHDTPYVESRVQQIPRLIRDFPPTYGRVKTGLAGAYFMLFRGYRPSSTVLKRFWRQMTGR
jgi:hypothetical protein